MERFFYICPPTETLVSSFAFPKASSSPVDKKQRQGRGMNESAAEKEKGSATSSCES